MCVDDNYIRARTKVSGFTFIARNHYSSEDSSETKMMLGLKSREHAAADGDEVVVTLFSTADGPKVVRVCYFIRFPATPKAINHDFQLHRGG
jgi:hypothetical protein